MERKRLILIILSTTIFMVGCKNNTTGQYETDNNVWITVLLLILMFACGCIIYNHIRKKRWTKEQELFRQKLSDKIKDLEQNRESMIIKLRCAALREQLFRRLSFTRRLPCLIGNNQIDRSRLNVEEVDEVLMGINNIWPGFTDWLQDEYPLLRPKDIVFCCLLKAGIAVRDMAEIYFVSPSAISQTKGRLKRDKFHIYDDNITLDDILDSYKVSYR